MKADFASKYFGYRQKVFAVGTCQVSRNKGQILANNPVHQSESTDLNKIDFVSVAQLDLYLCVLNCPVQLTRCCLLFLGAFISEARN